MSYTPLWIPAAELLFSLLYYDSGALYKSLWSFVIVSLDNSGILFLKCPENYV